MKSDEEIARTSLRKLFRAAEDLKAELSVDETSVQTLAPEAHTNPSDLFVFEVLDELEKMACAFLPLTEIYGSAEHAEQDATSRIIKEALADHSALWQRKLAEGLVELIGFRTTPEAGYYRDYILLARLDQILGSQTGQRNFWGAESANLGHQIQRLQAQIKDIERTGLDLSRAWYRAEQRPLRADPKPGRLFASFSRRLHHALGQASDTEKLALGLDYGSIFGRTSASLHGRPGRMDAPPRGSLLGELQIPILIGVNVLVACQSITQKIPGEHNDFFRRTLEANPRATAIVGRATEERAKVGDLVLAHGELCEILEIATGRHGYKAYRVRYLTRRLIPEIAEDHVVAPQVAVVLNVERARAMVEEQVHSGQMPRNIAEKMLSLPDEKLIAAFRHSTVELWNAGVGLKEAITSRATRGPDDP